MNQYLDEKDGKWHVSLSVDIPRILVKNKLNFRLHSVVMKNGEVVRDPSLSSSRYIFGIAPSFMGKKGFFFSYFEPTEIEEVDQFNFGLCDERVRWHEITIISIKNEMPAPVSEQEVHKVEYLSVEQELDSAEDIELAKEVISEIHIDTTDYIDSVSAIELTSQINNLTEEPFLASHLEVPNEAPKKAPAKKAGRKKK
jgi:hypothetical protein